MRLLALLLMLLSAAGVSAQPRSLSEQSDTREKDAPQQVAPAPSETITIPDGTPLRLQLVSGLDSATATVGDTVDCVTYPLRINGSTVVPGGMAVSGTVVQVDHPHRRSKNGLVMVALDKVVLPSGETATLRASKAPAGKPGKMKAQPGPPGLVENAAEAMVYTTMGIGLPAVAPLVLIAKGHEQVYPAGTRITAYINGPLNLDRRALLKLEPPPYKGPPQVFFSRALARIGAVVEDDYHALFCGDVRVDSLTVPLRLELNPGLYSFSARVEVVRDMKTKPVQLEVTEDHQYWIEAKGLKGFSVKDIQAHQAEFDIIQADSRTVDKDFTSSGPHDTCPQVAQSSAALLKLQPPPYKGPAQVFFNISGPPSYALFCGEVRVGSLSVPLRGASVPFRLKLNPGSYSFTVRLNQSSYLADERWANKHEKKIAMEDLKSKQNAKPVQLEVHEDHQYWIEGDFRELFVKDPQAHQAEFDLVQVDSRTVDKDFTALPAQDSCPQAAQPAGQPSVTPGNSPASARPGTTR